MNSLSIPNGVKIIDNYAFDNCNNLKSIRIPSSVIKIGEQTFSSPNLNSVTFEGLEEPLICNDNAFLNSPISSVIVYTSYKSNDFCGKNLDFLRVFYPQFCGKNS